MHPSATKAVHETHAAPSVPQLPGPGASQFAPAQHPDAQLLAVHDVHTPVWQFCDMGHGEHAVPPEPQYALVLPGSQVVPLQQPPGHEVPSQTQAPITQRCPAWHAAPPPHVQRPLAEQVSVVPPQVLQEPP